jgi:hypothetical protein
MFDFERDAVRKPGFLAIMLALSCVTATPAAAAIIVPVIDRSQVDVTVSVDVQFDALTGLYTYSYELTSGLGSVLDVESFAVETNAEVLNAQAPAGWDPGPFDDQPLFDFAAVQVQPLPPDYVDTGNIPPSAVSIKPGETLGGFSFQSPEGPTTVLFYAQGYAPAPQADSEDDFEGIHIPTFTENSFIGSTVGPGRDDGVTFAGGRRPSVDGFLGFVGINDRDTLSPPAVLSLRFAVNGETVDIPTFTAQLNRVDVTGSFQPTGNGDERVAIFDLAASPIVVGRNVLFTSVEGIVPGTTRTASDGDALTFFID